MSKYQSLLRRGALCFSLSSLPYQSAVPSLLRLSFIVLSACRREIACLSELTMLALNLDLLNARDVSTVFQKEISKSGCRLYCADEDALTEFEMLTLLYYQKLNDERKAILKAFQETGRGLHRMNDIVINKIQRIQCCVRRSREEYQADPDGFATNYTRQDAALLNVLRACETAIDLANHIIRVYKLGIPLSSSDSFKLLQAERIIDVQMRERLEKMVGFRNTVIH